MYDTENLEIGFKTGKGNLIPIKKEVLDKVKSKFLEQDDLVEPKSIESNSNKVKLFIINEESLFVRIE